MSKIINANPAGFPKNNIEESDSVNTLIYLLDNRVFKADIKNLDKFPNIDGYITVVDNQDIPIGKLEVQVKTLPNKNIKIPKYQCELEFLAYCENASLPVLLIVVNKKSNLAFWLHINRKFLKGLNVKGKSINLNFPVENVISLNDRKYIEDWKSIVFAHLHSLYYYHLLESKNLELEEKYNFLKDFPKPKHHLEPKNIEKLQLFIDTYNDLISRQFPILKELYYLEYWRIGIGYSIFLDTQVSYILYPIRIGENDLLIREIPESDFYGNENAISWHGNYLKNPIILNPIKYAWEEISKDVIEIVSKPLVRLVSLPLVYEYLVYLIDKIFFALNIPLKKRYNLETLIKRLNILYPLWVEETFRLNNNEKAIFSFSNLNKLMRNDSDRQRLSRAIIRYKNREWSKRKVSIEDNSIDFEYLNSSIKFLNHINRNVINRMYPAYDFKSPASSIYDARSFLSPEDIKLKIDTIYQLMPSLLKEYISLYLPLLKDEVSYFDTFDLEIININYLGGDGFDDGPKMEHYYLKADNSISPTIQTYLNENGSPITRKNYGKFVNSNILINSVNYKIVATKWSSSSEEMSNSAIRNVLNELVKDKVENYFKVKIENMT